MFIGKIVAIHWGYMNSNNLRGSGASRALQVLLEKIRNLIKSITTWVGNNKMISTVIAVIILLIIAGLIVFSVMNRQEPKVVKQTQIGLEYQQKLPALKESVDKSPKDATARKNYGVALYATGDIEEAKKQYEEAAKLDTKDAVILNNLGNIYRDLGQADKAIETYRKSIELSPKALNAYANLANVQLYGKNKPQEAIETYKLGLTELPGNTQLELLLAVAYEQANDPASAKKTYEAILTRDTENAAAKAALDRLK
jgi:tetratricopeptide (TPR) repeat protein